MQIKTQINFSFLPKILNKLIYWCLKLKTQFMPKKLQQLFKFDIQMFKNNN
jgi:flagellar biosynthesis protein FliQ